MSSQFPHDQWETKPGSPGTAANVPPSLAQEVSLRPGSRFGSYEVLAPLGKGGMGMVFRVRHVLLKKEFALKVLSARLARDEDAIQRFRRETEALGRLEDPHLVRATDAGVIDGVPFLVMELLEGVDLDRLTREKGQWPTAEATEVVRQAALGLQHAFERGLVHRDIKPSNLWLTPVGTVKVLDLGLARLRDDEGSAMTAAGMWMGTPDYIAPEQILDSHTADTRADLYSLGCTLFHLLNGDPPFGASTHPTLRQKSEAHLSEPPPDICRRRSDVPAGLAAVMARLLAKRPEDRYQTPAEAAAALTPFAGNVQLESLSGTHLPPTPATVAPTHGATAALPGEVVAAQAKPKRLERRRRWLVAAGLLLAGGIGLAIFLAQRRNPKPEQGEIISPSAAAPGSQEIRVLSLEVKHFANVDGRFDRPLGVLGKDSFAARRGDSVTIEARLSQPAYAFLIAFRPDGTEQVCFPEKEDAAPPLSDRPRYPSVSLGENYGLDEGAGLQAFALVVSSEPLPSYKEWRLRCSPSPWVKNDAPPGIVWRTDGVEDVKDLTADSVAARGKGRKLEGRTPMARLAGWLRTAPQVDKLAVLGFAVKPDEKP